MTYRISVHCEASGGLGFCGEPSWTADKLDRQIPPEFLTDLAGYGWARA